MDEQVYKELRKISEDLIFVKTTLVNMDKNHDMKIEAVEDKFEEKIKVANHRISDLEEQNKWLWRTVLVAVIGQLAALFFR